MWALILLCNASYYTPKILAMYHGQDISSEYTEKWVHEAFYKEPRYQITQHKDEILL